MEEREWWPEWWLRSLRRRPRGRGYGLGRKKGMSSAGGDELEQGRGGGGQDGELRSVGASTRRRRGTCHHREVEERGFPRGEEEPVVEGAGAEQEEDEQRRSTR